MGYARRACLFFKFALLSTVLRVGYFTMAPHPDSTVLSMLKISALPFPLLFSLLLSMPAWSQESLPLTVAAALQKAGIAASGLSVVLMPASGGAPVFTQFADRAMSPASTMKLLTTQIGLDELGPGFRWKTQILGESAVKKEVLSGNLYLRGGGDPNLTWDKLGIMLRKLRQQGLRKIDGDIVLDRHYFQPIRPDIMAAPFDETPEAYYNVAPDALLIHSNITSFALESDASKVIIHLMTPLDKIKIVSRLQLSDKACGEWEKGWLPPTIRTTLFHQIEITLNGSFPRNCQKTTHLNLLERNQYISHMLRLLWQEMGGSWYGEVVDGSTPLTATLLTERQSEPLADTLRIINKFSDNSMARMLYLSLGAESVVAKNYADHFLAADARVRNWFAQQGMSDTGLVLENGSGLSRTERISAQQLAGVLQAATRSNWYPEFASSLPIVAVDGTMRKRLNGSINPGSARIKTGTLKDALSVAGYVRDINGASWIVVGIINSEGLDKGKGRVALDELIAWVAAGRP